MIRSFFVVFVFYAVVGCNNSSTSTTTDKDSSNNNPNQTDTSNNNVDTAKTVFTDLEDWEIADSTFQRMQNEKCRFPLCKLKEHAFVETALSLIKQHYPEPGWTYKEVAAKFGVCDVARYTRTRPRKNPAHNNVRGRKTLIYVVTSSTNALRTEAHYFDICIICPPPNTGTCDLSQPVKKN